jgi:hypothetical protein
MKRFWIAKAFQNRQVQILCSFWITDSLELRRELLKASQSQLADFKSWPEPTHWFWKPARANLPILKASQSLSCQFSKAFCKFKSFSRWMAKNLLIQYKIKGTVKKVSNICRTFS